jgi:two-component system, LytTR family, sensor kinase
VTRFPRWALILGGWTAYGLLSSAQQVLGSSLNGRSMPWWMALALQMPLALVWAAATPGILWLGRRFPFHGGQWRTGVAVHLVVCLSFIFLLDLGYAWHASNVIAGPAMAPTLLSGALRLFIVWVLTDGLLYWTVLSIGYAVDHYARFRERELAASHLETQLVQADLRTLRMQLHPHFLFNALHTIAALVRTGERKSAVRVTAGLGALLRRMLDEARDQEVPLSQELDFIRTYLEIEQLRFPDRLKIVFDTDPAVLDAMVPQFILQPLVENAIRHGIAPHRSAGTIRVGALARGNRLRLVVQDDGKGLPAGPRHHGVGLSNTQARLTGLYGPAYTLDMTTPLGGGVEAAVEVPLRLSPAATGLTA